MVYFQFHREKIKLKRMEETSKKCRPRGSYFWENKEKIETKPGVSTSYISCRLLIFIVFFDVDLLEHVDVDVDVDVDRVWWALGVLFGVACALSFVEVPCAETCQDILGLVGVVKICLTCGIWPTFWTISSWLTVDAILTFLLTVPSHASFSTNWTYRLIIGFLVTWS